MSLRIAASNQFFGGSRLFLRIEGLDRDRTAPTRPDDAINGVGDNRLGWSPRSQIAFVTAAMPALLFLVVVAPYLLTHYVINRHDRFNYIPPPLGGDRALEGHWTDPPLTPARLVKIEDAQRGFGWIVPNDDLVAKVVPTASGTVEQVFVTVGQTVAKGAPIFSIRPTVADPPRPANDAIVVVSPIAGTITEISVAARDAVTAGKARTAAAALVADLARVWLAAEIEPDLARSIRPSETVEVRTTGLADKSFNGQVLTVSPVDAAVGYASVRILVENPDGALKPNMPATFSVPPGAEVLAIPQSAVLFENDTARVFVMEREADTPGASKLAARPIRIGRFGDGWVEVVEGLKPGEEVEATDAVFIDRAVKGY
jgi:multidrug efflux pump subunit AcrA (membrane-fusion protein)